MRSIPFLKSLTLFRLKTNAILSSAFVAVIVVLLASGCKKSDEVKAEEIEEIEVVPERVFLRDSISFEIDGKSYTSNNAFSRGAGNSGVNLRHLDAPTSNMKSWGGIGGGQVYSHIDSIYFNYSRIFLSSEDDVRLQVSFGKRYHVENMRSWGAQRYPSDIRLMLEKGRQDFATDSRNTTDGVRFVFDRLGQTGMSETEFGNSSDYAQDDAVFEIVEAEQVDEDLYRIKARFEMNLYDAAHVKRRATNGFLRLNVPRVWMQDLTLY